MVIPNPGGRRTSSGHGPSENQTHSQGEQPRALNDNVIEGENKLLFYASDLINLANNLRTLEPQSTVEQLRIDIDNLIKQFDTKLTQQSVSQEVIMTARYLLCCLIDEHVLSTPWGIDSSWSYQTLLSQYHNETMGGEKFFFIINKIMERPQQNIDLIELSYVCLALGFRGKYRRLKNSENEIAQISNMLYQPILQYRPADNELSPSSIANVSRTSKRESRIPVTLIFMLLGIMCIAVYIVLLSNLHTKSSPIFEKIESIGWEDLSNQALQVGASTRSVNQIAQDISLSLNQAIENNKLTVDVNDNKIILRFVSPQLFSLGSASVNPKELPNVEQLVETILAHTDTVTIVGHTDSSGKADSNWVLSRKRAESIEAWIDSANSNILRTNTKGVADTQPLTLGKDQSLNRRVELILVPKNRL